MIIDDLKYIIRPVIFDLNSDEFSYSMLGTSFGVFNKNEFFILVLDHVIGAVAIDDVRISYGLKKTKQFREFLPFNSKFFFKIPKDEEDTDRYELIALRIDKKTLNLDLFDKDSFIKLETKSKKIKYDFYDQLLIMGFPEDINEISYDEKVIKNQRFLITASLKKKAIMEGCHMINIDTNNDLSTYSGLSGSPVFGILQYNHKQSSCDLLGVMVRASKSSGTGYFLEIEGIRVLINI